MSFTKITLIYISDTIFVVMLIEISDSLLRTEELGHLNVMRINSEDIEHSIIDS